MKKISELGLELIELEDQVLLVDKEKVLSKNGDWYLSHHNNTIHRWGMYGMHEEKQAWITKIMASIKPLEGLPLLVIEDEVENLANQAEIEEYKDNDPYDQFYAGGDFYEGFKQGYNKAKETSISFQDEFDLADKLRISYLNHGKDSWVSIAKELILNEAKKELWVEVEYKDLTGRWYPVDKFVDIKNQHFEPLGLRPKITDNKIRAVWK